MLYIQRIVCGCAAGWLLASSVCAEPTFTLTANGKSALKYRAADDKFKPYVAELYTPAGVQVLRDAPADHLHHHGLMFAIGVEGVSFWEERPASGREVSRDVHAHSEELGQALDWKLPDGKVVLNEVRNIIVHSDQPATLLTWRSRLSAPPGCAEVKLTGSHYYGLGARFITSMDKIGTFINSANATGDVVRGTERLTNAKWCAYTAPVDDKPVTFAMFDHPQNLRHPNKMFTMLMPFSYLSVTYNLWKEPYELKAGSPLDLRYGVAVWDGKVAANQVEATYRAWVKLAGR